MSPTAGARAGARAGPRARARSPAEPPVLPPPSAPQESALDTTFLETLVGYNARRAALVVIAEFLKQMAPYGLRPVEFSVLTLIGRNPGVTSRQLCAALGILAPNLVSIVSAFERRGLVLRQAHPHDRRALGLTLTAQGHSLIQQAEQTATQLEVKATAKLSRAERKTLLQLLQKIYL